MRPVLSSIGKALASLSSPTPVCVARRTSAMTSPAPFLSGPCLPLQVRTGSERRKRRRQGLWGEGEIRGTVPLEPLPPIRPVHTPQDSLPWHSFF